MSLTDNEKLELAKKCGAAYGPTTDNICFLNREQLGKYTDAYTSAIEEKQRADLIYAQEMVKKLQAQVESGLHLAELAQSRANKCQDDAEKYQAQIAMLQNSVKRVLISFGSENDCPAIGYIEPMALDFVGTGSVSAGERAEKDFYRTVIQPCEHALSATQATADAFIAEVKARALEEAVQRIEDSGMTQPQARNEIRRMAAELRNSVAQAEVEQCPNCDTDLPRGCGGRFKNEGHHCWLNRAQPEGKEGK